MFEKEATEYREKGKSEGYYLVTQEMEQEALDYIIDESFKDGAESGYNKAKEEDKERLIGMAILPTVQFKRMGWNEDKLWTLIKRLKNDERTKDLFSFSEDKFGRFDFVFNG